MLSLRETPNGLDILVNGATVLSYADGSAGRKPYLHPLALPGGPVLTEDSPEDHLHHHGAWFAHHQVLVGGASWDFYLERGNAREGRQVHLSYDRLVSSGDIVGFRAHHQWVPPTETPVARATWDVRVSAEISGPEPRVLVDWDIMLAAVNEPLTLLPTNESAMPLIRPAPGLAVRGSGQLLNSRGQRNEGETFGRPAEWLDCSGLIGEQRCGIAIFDHPRNPAFPQPWFTRNYGPFGPHFSYFTPPLVIPAWKPLLLRYRLVLHHGDAQEAGLQTLWQDYVADTSFGNRASHFNG